ncbi:MAG: hypothetical protein KAR05_11185 [Candidatus Omnitrophica bacterium]|nr:hypothetical protein [Candidatus Omnitrophota bacterium]
MKRIFPLTISFICLLLLPLRAQPLENTNNTSPQEQTITLKDGTILKGYLVDVKNNFYTIKTKHMGQVNISVNDLKSITTMPVVTEQKPDLNNMMSAMLGGGQPMQSLRSNSMLAQLPQLQSQFMSDPDFMAMVQEIMQDESFMRMMNQGDLMSTLMTMDPAQMQNNPAMQQFLQNPKMQKIINYITEKMVTPR